MPRQAKNNPVLSTTSNEVLATDHQIGQPQSIDMPASGSVSRSDLKDDIQVVPGPRLKEKADAMAFNNEILTVVVHETTNPSDVPIPVVRVDGRSQYFIRGQSQQVKRMFVEGLARAKKETVNTREATDGNGNRNTVIDKMPALKYPFSVLEDPNPKGRAWLQQVLAQP